MRILKNDFDMTKALLFLFFLSSGISAFAQCEPQTDFGDEPFGVSPDTIVNFAPAPLNVLYIQQIDVKVPENGAFLGAIGAALTVDSAGIQSISGLPTGLTYECTNPLTSPCTFPGGSQGCAVVSGIPTVEGVYELNVVLLVYGQSPFGAINLPFPVEGYRIVVGDPLSTDVAQSFSFALKPNVPNPADQLTELHVSAPTTARADIKVYDLLGKLVKQEQVLLRSGANALPLNTSMLPTGVYVYRVDAFGESLSSRLLVSR